MSDPTERYSKLTKAELIERLTAHENTPVVPPVEKAEAYAGADVEALIQRNQELTTALIASREIASRAPAAQTDDAVYRVENVRGVALAFSVSDPRSGLPRLFSMEKRGAFVFLTKAQVEELQDKSPHFFERGYVSIPELVADTPNTIPNIPAFLKGLTHETADAAIEQITSRDTLFDLFHHIENMRWSHLDKEGRALTEKDGSGNAVLVMEEKKLDAVLRIALMAVQRRIAVVANKRISLDGN